MKTRLRLAVGTAAAAVLLLGLAATAHGFPTRTTACSGCHSGVNVPVTATLLSTVGTTATYSFSSPTADSVAVFDGSTKLFTFNATTGQFAVTTGKTYTLEAVAGPGTGDGLGTTTVSPVAPVVDATAPVTTSDAKTTYVSSATVKLTATDAGSGVAATYYKLDGGAQTSGTTVNVTALGSHTIEFWSVDVAGNIETHKTVSFTITAPVPVDTEDTYTVRVRVSIDSSRGRIATLTNETTGQTFTAVVGRKGYAVFTNVPAGTYSLSVRTKRGEKILRTITVSAPVEDDDSDDLRSYDYDRYERSNSRTGDRQRLRD